VTNETDSFVQEVDERVRQDQVLSAAKKYGPYLIGIFIAVLIGLGAWQWWQDKQRDDARRHADLYVAAQDLARNGDIPGAKAAFERLTTDGPPNYRAMAHMEHAAILQTEGDLEGALRDFDAAAALTKDPIMRQSAQLRAAYIAADTQDFPALQHRLQPLIDGGGQISYLARELLGIEAWENGQNDLARETFENLRLAFEAPESIHQRAQIALAVIGPAPAGAAAPASAGHAGQPAAPARAPSEGETK
jgi:hypothetical protein